MSNWGICQTAPGQRRKEIISAAFLEGNWFEKSFAIRKNLMILPASDPIGQANHRQSLPKSPFSISPLHANQSTYVPLPSNPPKTIIHNKKQHFSVASHPNRKLIKMEDSQALFACLQQDYMNFNMQIALMENPENIWDHSHSQLSERYSEPIPQTTESPIKNAELLEARERLLSFMGELHELRKSDIREDILQHCEQVNKNKKVISSYISDETIVKLVSGRIDKMVKNKKLKKNWSEEDVKILVWVISKYCDQQRIENADKDLTAEDWQRIARLIPGVTGSSCMFKWLSIRKTNLSNCSWSAAESQLLREIIDGQQPGQAVENFTHLNWKAVAEELYFRNGSPMKVFRSSKQCREHWNCFLNPRLKKGPWLLSEDVQLLTLIKNNNGCKKWSEIVYYFEGRTENALKNRYTLLLDKQRRISKSKQEIALVEDCLERYYEQLNCSGFADGVVLEPIVDFKEEAELKESCSLADSLEKESQNGKSEANTISSGSAASPVPVPPGSRVVTKIHYLTSSDQLQFLEWMKRRSDIRRCCLKNGSFQMDC